ncbi:hypothetical protein GCM10010123_41560 [Pilimelia anulata]|uniref:DUF6879 domain-containing protein n=1 Tax=Pilimelia anulata TaxID=53371 RepID=A0A8J3BAC3_9ACTN|nr:DUF6879 family protein [Pilimelia anulata]GGK07343.1 hypothetical protein GCM10010123_41560 [Pilimelia anulata]
MASIDVKEFECILNSLERSYVHLEMRSSYGTDAERLFLGRDLDDTSWLEEWPEMVSWCDTLRRYRAEGKSCRRVHIIDEPLNDYWRWSHAVTKPLEDAGEENRWLARPTASGVELPPDDFYLFDDELVVYLRYTSAGENADFLTSRADLDIETCRSAFEAAWNIATPHRVYRPA